MYCTAKLRPWLSSTKSILNEMLFSFCFSGDRRSAAPSCVLLREASRDLQMRNTMYISHIFLFCLHARAYGRLIAFFPGALTYDWLASRCHLAKPPCRTMVEPIRELWLAAPPRKGQRIARGAIPMLGSCGTTCPTAPASVHSRGGPRRAQAHALAHAPQEGPPCRRALPGPGLRAA